jgi:hypothetical protein
MNDNMNFIDKLTESYIEKSKRKDYWSGSYFEKFLNLSSDEKGQYGEELIKNLFEQLTSIFVEWEGNTNVGRKDGSIWDILINNYKTEIKMAMLTFSSGIWQHEKLVEDCCWDKVIFVDVDYSGIWFTVQNHSQIPFHTSKHSILNKKSTWHLGGWKFDLTEQHLKKLEKHGMSFYLEMKNMDLNGLKVFFEKHFS